MNSKAQGNENLKFELIAREDNAIRPSERSIEQL